MMILVLVLIQIVAVLSATSPRAPRSVEVQNGILRWTPAAEEAEEDTTYSVQFWRFEEERWSNLPRCVRTAEDSCNVTALIREADHGCVRFRVRGQRGQLRSEAVEACSASEDRCTPQLRLSAAPGSITVHLSRDHSLWEEYADHAKHCVRYWSQDQPKPQACSYETVASLDLAHLQPGQTYCVEVQYLNFSNLSGVPRCPLCIQVPQAKSKHTEIVLGILLTLLVLGLGSTFVYILLFHKKKMKKIKNWFKPEPRPGWLDMPLEGASVCSSPTEEHCSVITGLREKDQD